MYQEMIRESLARQGFVGAADPKLIEGWMRLGQGGTLDHLTRAAFDLEVAIALECIREAGEEESRKLAESYAIF